MAGATQGSVRRAKSSTIVIWTCNRSAAPWSILLALTIMAQPGCGGRRGDKDDKRAVSQALEWYADGEYQRAREVMLRLGDRAVPHLKRELRSSDRSVFDATKALSDVGTDAAYTVLVEALRGGTRLEPTAALTSLALFLLYNDWPAERARRVADPAAAVLSLMAAGKPLWTYAGLVQWLELVEALPMLRELVTDPEYRTRYRAAQTIHALCGEVVEFGDPEERYTGQRLEEGLLSLRASFSVDGRPITGARFYASPAGTPGIIVVCADLKRRKDPTEVSFWDLAGTQRFSGRVGGTIDGAIALPYGAVEESVCFAAVVKEASWTWGGYSLRGFTDRLAELWRIDFPPGTRTVGSDSLCWLYDEAGDVTGLIAASLGGSGLGTALDLQGTPLWTLTTLKRSPVSNACVPGRVLGHGEYSHGPSTVDLVHSRGAETPLPKVGSCLRGEIVPTGQGSCGYALLVNNAREEPQIAFIGADLQQPVVCDLSSRVAGLGSVYRACGETSRAVVVLLESGTLLVLDDRGTLRWRGQVGDRTDVLFRPCGLDVLREPGGNARTILTYWSQHIQVWDVNEMGQ